MTATVAQPAIAINSYTIGNNTYSQLGITINARTPTNETMTVTSSDPAHFLLSTSASVAGSASVNVQLTANDPYVPVVYIQGQNFSGSTAITATVTASAPLYNDGTATQALYPTGIGVPSYSAINTSSTSAPTQIRPQLMILSPGSLSYYLNYA